MCVCLCRLVFSSNSLDDIIMGKIVGSHVEPKGEIMKEK